MHPRGLVHPWPPRKVFRHDIDGDCHQEQAGAEPEQGEWWMRRQSLRRVAGMGRPSLSNFLFI
jgi:hypothetical protein